LISEHFISHFIAVFLNKRDVLNIWQQQDSTYNVCSYNFVSGVIFFSFTPQAHPTTIKASNLPTRVTALQDQLCCDFSCKDFASVNKILLDFTGVPAATATADPLELPPV